MKRNLKPSILRKSRCHKNSERTDGWKRDIILKQCNIFRLKIIFPLLCIFVALIKYRITRNIEFSEKAKRYKDKFSHHGFKDHLATEYKAAPGFMTKIVFSLIFNHH